MPSIVPALRIPESVKGITDTLVDRAVGLLRDSLIAVIGDVEKLKVTPTWINVPAFSNGWVAYGAPGSTPAYWKDPWGRVHLRGLVKSGTLALPVFTLPAECRPTVQCQRAVATAGTGVQGTSAARVVVETSGTVTLYDASTLGASLDCEFWIT